MLVVNLTGVVALLVAGAVTYWWSMRYGDDWDGPDDGPEDGPDTGPPAPQRGRRRPVSRPHSRPSRRATQPRRRSRQTA